MNGGLEAQTVAAPAVFQNVRRCISATLFMSGAARAAPPHAYAASHMLHCMLGARSDAVPC